jgi:putative ABC transport system ATP-binding protein
MVLADEPTGSLDLETAAIVADLLLSLAREEGVLLVMVTHSEELAARSARRARLAAGVLA